MLGFRSTDAVIDSLQPRRQNRSSTRTAISGVHLLMLDMHLTIFLVQHHVWADTALLDRSQAERAAGTWRDPPDALPSWTADGATLPDICFIVRPMKFWSADRRIFIPLTALMVLANANLPAPAAQALNGCYSDVVGTWRGPVLNDVGIQDMTTSFSIGADGTLVGRYHIEGALPLDGTLTDYRETGHCSGDFHWHDRDGSGTVHLRFQPELGRFLGHWGLDRPTPGNVFNGYRSGPMPVS